MEILNDTSPSRGTATTPPLKLSPIKPLPRDRASYLSAADFKFLKVLGQGSFGKVYLAQYRNQLNNNNSSLFAVKAIPKPCSMAESDQEEIRHTIIERDILEILNRHRHPFIASLEFAFQSTTTLYIGMCYVPGGSLASLIQKHTSLELSTIQAVAAQLVVALSHLHGLDIAYRDLKPDNIMLSSRGQIILVDFGLSKKGVTPTSRAYSLVGTPNYCAPEVLKSGIRLLTAKKYQVGAVKNDGYGKAVDWWSLGVVIYEMLGGMPPFQGSDLRDTYKR